jgi:hypothetical protein
MMSEEKAQEYLKFYADTPAIDGRKGDKNKLFTFKVHDLGHACDLLVKFVRDKGFVIRAAYYVNQKKLSVRIDTIIDFDDYISSYELKKQLD